MNRSVKYRQNAAECYEAARILSDPRNSHFEAATTGLTNHGNGPGVVDPAASAMGRKGGPALAAP
jgi:hypothetical protein